MIHDKQQISTIVRRMRNDIRVCDNDKDLAVKLNISLLTYYKRLAFNDWKVTEINNFNELINNHPYVKEWEEYK